MAQYHEVLDGTGLTKTIETAAAGETAGYVYNMIDTQIIETSFGAGLYLIEDVTTGNSAVIQITNTTGTLSMIKLASGAAGINTVAGANDRINVYKHGTKNLIAIECQMDATPITIVRVKPLAA
ncbi:MAG: hypothetical protein HRS51_01250 [Candidatus Nitrosopelagicus sp.]|nr:hypothetical protein [Candidatus Nitrosopelagicus sp.]